VTFKDSDDHIPDIAVIIDDENMLWWLIILPTSRGWLSDPAPYESLF
jgi:hypothetical protein